MVTWQENLLTIMIGENLYMMGECLPHFGCLYDEEIVDITWNIYMTYENAYMFTWQNAYMTGDC